MEFPPASWLPAYAPRPRFVVRCRRKSLSTSDALLPIPRRVGCAQFPRGLLQSQAARGSDARTDRPHLLEGVGSLTRGQSEGIASRLRRPQAAPFRSAERALAIVLPMAVTASRAASSCRWL